MAKKSKKGRVTKREKKTAATKGRADTSASPAVKETKRQAPNLATATARGARYAVLAGRPSKQAVIAVFGNSGYALSWVARAAKLKLTPEKLCEKFKSNPDGVKAAWTALAEKK